MFKELNSRQGLARCSMDYRAEFHLLGDLSRWDSLNPISKRSVYGKMPSLCPNFLFPLSLRLQFTEAYLLLAMYEANTNRNLESTSSQCVLCASCSCGWLQSTDIYGKHYYFLPPPPPPIRPSLLQHPSNLGCIFVISFPS